MAVPDPNAPLSTPPPEKGGRRYPSHDRVTVLVVDARRDVITTIAALLDQLGVEVVECLDAADALFQAGRRSPDLILLSAAVSTVAACELIATVRRYDDVPVVLGVGVGETGSVGSALLAGASGVLTHPYRESEVRAWINRILPDLEVRRVQNAKLSVGQVELDGPGMAVRVQGKSITLTLREFELLRLLMLNAGRVVSHQEIHDQIWASRGEDVTPRTVSVHMHRLRGYLSDAAELVAVRGIGYRLSTSNGHPATSPAPNTKRT